MKSVSVQYFALLREEAGKDLEEISVPCLTYGELYTHLREKYQFTLPLEMIQVAVNDEFSSLTSLITAGERIVFIPPVAGG